MINHFSQDNIDDRSTARPHPTTATHSVINSPFDSGKEGVRGGEREVENGKGGGSDKPLRYSPDGRELDLYYPPS